MNSEFAPLRVDPERLWSSLEDMAAIGQTPQGGCNRQALTDEDRRGRDLFSEWAEAEGCRVWSDQIGNLFGEKKGTRSDLHPVLIGSHLDTQPAGGRFDGVYGVLAGLEVLRTIKRAGVQTRRSIQVASWTNEEGFRFAPAMLGSGVAAGAYSLEYAYSRSDKVGLTVEAELQRVGYRGAAQPGAQRYSAAFEAHIEQGPILESEAKTIGVVTGIQGAYWFDVTLTGASAHAGPTPMELRLDPWRATCPIIQHVFDVAHRNGPWGRATIGAIRANPGSRNTVPHSLVFSVDLRHPDRKTLEAMVQDFQLGAEGIAESTKLSLQIEQVWHMPPTSFDQDLVQLIDTVAGDLGYPRMRMVSGAGHDSLHIARVAPTAMIFVPCASGLNHNDAESAKPEDLVAGANVLLQAVLHAANA